MKDYRETEGEFKDHVVFSGMENGRRNIERSEDGRMGQETNMEMDLGWPCHA